MRIEYWRRLAVALMTCAGLLAVPAVAQQAAVDQRSDDPALEARVKQLGYELRCLVCQNETIAESHAPLAIDLRNQVREQLASGRSEDEVKTYLVERYGDFVLFRPPFKASTLLLWLGPAVLLVIAMLSLFGRLRRRQHETAAAPELSAAERAEARALLGADSPPSSLSEENRS